MQAAPEAPAPDGLVYDGEMRGEPQDLIALATVYGLSMSAQPEAEALTFSLTGSSLQGAAYVEAVARFYNQIHLRDYPERFQRYRGLAIGLAEGADIDATEPALSAALNRKNAEGEPLYEHEVNAFTDTADPAALIRNGLTAREDQSVIVTLTGAATNLARVLGLNGGPELIESKVKRLVVALGDPATGKPDAHVKANVDAARKLFAEWPTPIVIVGASLAEDLTFPGDALAGGCDWTENHPIVEAYLAAGAKPEISAREAAVVLHAIRPDEGYFTESEAGNATVGADGSVTFEPGAAGRCRYLKFDPAQADAVQSTLVELVTARPAARELPDFLKRFIEREKKEQEEQQQEEEEPDRSAR